MEYYGVFEDIYRIDSGRFIVKCGLEHKWFLFIRRVTYAYRKWEINGEEIYLSSTDIFIWWLSEHGMSEERIKELFNDDNEYRLYGHWPLFFDTRIECEEFWKDELGLKFDDDGKVVNIIDNIIYSGSPKAI